MLKTTDRSYRLEIYLIVGNVKKLLLCAVCGQRLLSVGDFCNMQIVLCIISSVI